MLSVVVCGNNTLDVLSNLKWDNRDGIKKIAVLEDKVVNTEACLDKYIYIGDCIEKIKKSKGRMEVSFQAESAIQMRLSQYFLDTEIAVVTGVVSSYEDLIMIESVCGLLTRMGILNLCMVCKNESENVLDDIIYNASFKGLKDSTSSIFHVKKNQYKGDFKELCVCLYDLIHFNGVFNLHVGDLYDIFQKGRPADIYYAQVVGENRGRQIVNGLFCDEEIIYRLRNANNVLISIKGNRNLSLYEIKSITEIIKDEVFEDAGIIFGTIIKEDYDDKLKISMIIN